MPCPTVVQVSAVSRSPSKQVWVFVKMALRSVCVSSAVETLRGLEEVSEIVWKKHERYSKLREARYLQSRSAAIAEGDKVEECLTLRYLLISLRNLRAVDKDLRNMMRP